MNIILLLAISFVLIYYVSISNSVASRHYESRVLGEKLSSLSEANSGLISKKIQLEQPSVLISLANDMNMVEALNIQHIFEKGAVAKR
jgi:hypothetical protein